MIHTDAAQVAQEEGNFFLLLRLRLLFGQGDLVSKFDNWILQVRLFHFAGEIVKRE